MTPTKFTPLTVSSVLAGIRMGMPQHQAAAAAGVASRTWKTWLAEREELAEMVAAAEADFTYKHVKNLDDIALSGNKNSAQVSQWLLERRDPATWGRSTRNDMWTREQQVRALVEELRREGLDVTEEQIYKEVEQAEKNKALPSGQP